MSSSTDLHRKGKSEIFKLFNQNFIKIINGKIKPKKQLGRPTYFNKKSIQKYDELKLNKFYNLLSLIRLNNARTANHLISLVYRMRSIILKF